ncbi:MAG: hypothetical protein QOG43_1559 [Actinomycetota bacterium]|nr:hypothetical protein [Actinomycetota bacterium]
MASNPAQGSGGLQGLATRWNDLATPWRVNVALYALTALSLVALLFELVAGGGATPTVDLASQVPVATSTSTSSSSTSSTSTSSTSSTSSTTPAPVTVTTRRPVVITEPPDTEDTVDPDSTSTTEDPNSTSTTEDPNTTSTTEDPNTTSTTEDPNTTTTTAVAAAAVPQENTNSA